MGTGKTRLTADVVASATSCTVENNDNFAANDYAVFGQLGQEKSEIVKITSATGNTTLGHTTGPVFAHSARTPVNEIKYNQVKVYTSASEDGTYSLLATLALDADEEYTVYDDTTGTSSTWYKVKYYNSTATTLSDYSDPVQGTGYTSDSLFDMTEEVLDDFGDPDCKEVSRSQIKRYLRAGVRKLTRELIKYFPDYRRKYTTQNLTSGTAEYNLPTRFLAFYRVDVNLTGTSATSGCYKAGFESEFSGEPESQYSTNDPRIYFRSSGNTEQFGIRPTPAATGKAFLWYWDYPEEMTEENDEHGLPYGARDILVTYALVRLWRTKETAKADEYKIELATEVTDYLEFVAQGKQYVNTKYVEVTGVGSDIYEWVE